MYDVLSALLSTLLSALLLRYSLTDSGGEEKTPSDRALRCPGGQDKECVLKLSWPSTAEYRIIKLKKKKKSSALSVCSP